MEVHKPFYTTKKSYMLRQQPKRCVSLAAMLLFHACFFSRSVKLRG